MYYFSENYERCKLNITSCANCIRLGALINYVHFTVFNMFNLFCTCFSPFCLPLKCHSQITATHTQRSVTRIIFICYFASAHFGNAILLPRFFLLFRIIFFFFHLKCLHSLCLAFLGDGQFIHKQIKESFQLFVPFSTFKLISRLFR